MAKKEGYDILIVGGGLAGLTTAVTIADNHKSLKIALISKVHPLRSQTGSAQGGINAVISKDDSLKAHLYDTVKYSDFLADQDKVEAFVKEGPIVIEELEKYGAMFTRKEGGEIDQMQTVGKAFLAQRDYGMESYPRACYAADRTGQVLLQTMYEQVKKRGIKLFETHFVTSLIMSENTCVGVNLYDVSEGTIESLKSNAVILCTGGHGAIYNKTTNSTTSTGDGPALALRAGAYLMDMEFIQFHPSVLKGKSVMIPDSVRAEGAYIVNKEAERFMKNYSKRLMESSLRDVVTRAIINEINHGNGIDKKDYVYLDLRHLGKEKILERLHSTRDLCLKHLGLDPVTEMIPIHPAQHYSLGGISTDAQGSSSIPGLYACGECACVSVHGANRLGGNALLETVVFGKRAATSASEYIEALREEKLFKEFPDDAESDDEDYIEKLKSRTGGEHWSSIKRELKELMDEDVGVFRNEAGLISALKEVQDLQNRFKNVSVIDKGSAYNTEVIEVLELKNMLDVSETIIAGALAREETRGSHFRTDFPEKRNLKYLKHTLIRKTDTGLKLSYKDVNISQFKPE